MSKRSFPIGCMIIDIRQKRGHTFATLIDSTGSTLINATLEYITEQLKNGLIADAIVEEIPTIEGTAPWDFITTDGAKE